MNLAPLDHKARTERASGVIYAEMPLGGTPVGLSVDLFLPGPKARPAPLLVWLGPHILTDRMVQPSGPQRLAHLLTRGGVALALPRVRAGAARSDLTDDIVERMSELSAQRDLSVDATLSSLPAVAATQDICALMRWAKEKGPAFGLSGHCVLAGASLGAGLAFSGAVVAPHLGIARPDPVGLLSYSGTCAWPTLYTPGMMQVFALHNPNDRRMPIGPMRMMADTGPHFELIESIEQTHGSLGLWPQESTQQAAGRILARVRRWCAP